jgi:enoyl-CoA hydratase/carnithine racemase
MGIVNKTFKDEEFDDEVMAYAKELAKSVSPRSIKIMKEQIYNAQKETIDENLNSSMKAMLESFESEDFKEGVNHYMEKREPKFTGK